MTPPAPPAAPGPRLHPLDVGRVFQLTFDLVRFRWRALFGAAALILVPPYAILAAVNVATGAQLAEWSLAWQLAMSEPRPRLEDLPPVPAGPLLLSLGSTLLASLAGVLAGGAAVWIVARTYEGAPATAAAGVRASLARAGTLVGSHLLVILAILAVAAIGVAITGILLVSSITAAGLAPGPAVLVGLIAIVGTVAATVFVGLRWSMLSQAIMVEGRGAVGGLGRSWSLVAGSTWRVLGYFLLFGVIAFVVGLLLGLVAVVIGGADAFGLQLTPDPWSLLVQSVFGGLAGLLITPYWAAMLTLLYYDLRWRRGELRPPAPPGPHG